MEEEASVTDEYRKEIRGARRDLLALMYKNNGAAPLLLRLAFNDAATYCKVDRSGGPNGSIRLEEEYSQSCNKGLKPALDYCEEIKREHPLISYADIYQLAGVVAVEIAGGPAIDFTPGRRDSEKWTEEGRLPNHREGADSLRDKFFFLGLYDKDVVALSGAHTLGRAHTEVSGFDGPWTKDPLKFDNSYFVELLKEEPEGGLVQLPSDRALVEDPQYKKFVQMYAEDKELFFTDYALAHKKLAEISMTKFTPYVPKRETKKKSSLMSPSVVGVAIAASLVVVCYRIKGWY